MLIGVAVCLLFFFFFQAEDGIRDIGVTGVQTCALPISQTFKSQQSRELNLKLSDTSAFYLEGVKNWIHFSLTKNKLPVLWASRLVKGFSPGTWMPSFF